MTQSERLEKAAANYILSPIVPVGNEKLAFGDFINGAKWNQSHQWISVDDELPKEYGVYLVMINSKIPTITPFDVKNKRWGLLKDYIVTHWMPIPKLKEE